MSVLVIGEIVSNQVTSATRSAVTAALQLGGEIHLLIAGSQLGDVTTKARAIAGVTKVLVLDHADLKEPLAEELAPIVAGLVGFTHVVLPASSFGKDLAPRIAALLDVQQVSEVIRVVSPDTSLHPVYAGNALETVQSSDPVKLLTIRSTAFDAAPFEDGSAGVEMLSFAGSSGLSRFVRMDVTESARPELGSAKIVISGGRGLGSKDNFRLLERIAYKLGAALGASRAAVDAGYVPNDYQVGQTGKVVAPELYLAVGISGAIQHLAGMKDSKVIVAINKDENAPIFEIADYGLVGDLFEILPKLEALL